MTKMPEYEEVQETPRNFRLGTWHLSVQGFKNIKGFGLSNQSWLSDNHLFWNSFNLPPHELASWTTTALSRGADVVQVEPLWYFFDWPAGKFPTSEQISDPSFAAPKKNMLVQLNLFGAREQ